MLGPQASNERLYMERKDGRRGLKSLREVYEETRLRVGCYMFVSDNRWIKEAWKQEKRNECNSIKDEIILKMQTKGKTVQFEGEDMKLEGKILDREFKRIWKQVKNGSKKVMGKNESNSTEKRKCKVKYTINKTKSAIYGWNRIYGKKNSHYVNDRTNG